MNVESIEQAKREVIERFGPWTAHNIHLGGDVYTIERKIVGDEIKLNRIVQCVADVSARPLRSLRILDLACLEGLYAVELARHGASVVGIEGREANLAKARFAKEALALDNLELLHDDVRNLSREKHGRFDVVLCLGILYHLDVPDGFLFLERIAEVCTGFAIFDTHVGMQPEKSSVFRGRDYWGRAYKEHEAESTPEERAKSLWASLDNPESFWFTRASLVNLLSHLGFTSVYECRAPAQPNQPEDRVTFVAIKGRRVELLCSPLLNAQPAIDVPEETGDKT